MNDKHILLVEDNPDDAALTLRAFKKQGIRNRIEVARDGVEAMEALFGKDGEHPPRLPILILLDLQLPRVSGLEVLQRIRSEERTRHIPVVVLTTSNEQRDIVSSYSFGANSYVRKPVDYEGFNEAVRQLGFYWLLLNEAPPEN